MAQRAFRFDELARPARHGQEGRADSCVAIGSDEPRSARPEVSRPAFIPRSLVAVHNAPLALLLRARRFFANPEQVKTAVLTLIVGVAAVYFWISFFSEALR